MLLNLAGCCTGLMEAVGHWVGQGTLGLRKEYLNSNINVNVCEIIYWRRIFRFKYVRTKKEMMMIIRLCVFESDLEVPRVPATQATLSPFQDGARLGNIQDPSSKMEQDGERSKIQDGAGLEKLWN